MTTDNRSDANQRVAASDSQEPNFLMPSDETRAGGADVYGARPATADETVARRAFQYRSFHCPTCFANIAIRREQMGQKITCPDCRSVIIAPSDLDFNSPTEYEKKYFDSDKKKRDELYSPTRNPNRVGIDLNSTSVYGVLDASSLVSNSDELQYVAIRCSVCGTIMQVPRSELGTKVRCPDCFTETVVKDSQTHRQKSAVELEALEEEKKKRDELYSPTRNPNRVGIDLQAHDVYGISGESVDTRTSNDQNHGTDARQTSQVSKRPKSVLYPVRCRLCETIMHVPREKLGQEVVCPDCGAATIATAVFKEQQETIETKFQPRDRGTYGIGEVPLPPNVTYRTERGETVRLDGSKPSIAPTRRPEEKSITLEEFKQRHISNGGATATSPASEEKSAGATKRDVAKRRDKKNKSKSPPPPESVLPDRVLRQRNGEFIWTAASPPTPAPLFNGSFRLLAAADLWARVIILGILVATGILLFGLARGAVESSNEFFRSTVPLIVAAATAPVAVFVLVVFTNFFTTLYRVSAMGARRVIDWSSDEQFLGSILSGIRLVLFAVASGSCGLAFAVLAQHTVENIVDLELNELHVAIVTLILASALAWFFFTVFWVSSDARGALFCPITTSVLAAFYRRKMVWFQFVLYVLLVLTPTTLVSVLALMSERMLVNLLAAITIPVLVILASPIIGRLAWIVEDNTRNATFDD